MPCYPGAGCERWSLRLRKNQSATLFSYRYGNMSIGVALPLQTCRQRVRTVDARGAEVLLAPVPPQGWLAI